MKLQDFYTRIGPSTKLRRRIWRKDVYIEQSWKGMVMVENGLAIVFPFSVADAVADDWEVVDDPE